jgi:hypothetical protein
MKEDFLRQNRANPGVTLESLGELLKNSCAEPTPDTM